MPVAGRVEVVRAKRRFTCPEPACPGRMFVEATDQVPLRAQLNHPARRLVLD